jgi:hypothetical protein
MLNNTIRNTINSQRGGLTGLNKIFSDYGFLNMWTSENIDVSGTVTTLIDYAGEHDLVNPAAANQPTFNSSSANFGGRPSLTYNGTTDYVYKAVSDWRGSDSSGVIISVFRLISGGDISFLASANEGGTSPYFYQLINTNTLRVIHTGTARSYRGATVINDTNPHVVSYASTGSVYKTVIDGNNDAVTMIQNADDGSWLDGILLRDNITIGAMMRTTIGQYGNLEWVMSGYLPYVDDSTLITLNGDLNSHYGGGIY